MSCRECEITDYDLDILLKHFLLNNECLKNLKIIKHRDEHVPNPINDGVNDLLFADINQQIMESDFELDSPGVVVPSIRWRWSNRSFIGNDDCNMNKSELYIYIYTRGESRYNNGAIKDAVISILRNNDGQDISNFSTTDNGYINSFQEINPNGVYDHKYKSIYLNLSLDYVDGPRNRENKTSEAQIYSDRGLFFFTVIRYIAIY